MSLTVGSTFTGVGGADLGFEWAGMTIKWQCEIDSWKRQVLAAHWPDVPIYEDICGLENPEPVDVLVGGFPCQDLSIAGKRKGFDGERSVLAFEFLRVAESLKPRWLVLENVPGLLSSNGGRDFARLIDEVVACGYGVAWRCLDARYFAVPQRRRRIFIVARRVEAGADPREASGLALRALSEGGVGDLTSCIPPGKEVAGTSGIIAESGGREPDISPAVTAKWKKGTGGPSGDECQNLVAFRKSARVNADPDSPESWVDDGRANTLNRFDVGDVRTTHAVVDTASTLQGSGASLRGQRIDAEGAAGGHLAVVSPALTKYNLDSRSPQSQEQQRIVEAVHKETSVVRRLTPTECERLMGWPDNWTAPEGMKAPDSRRYAACGDGIVANVAYWIGQRIVQIDKETV